MQASNTTTADKFIQALKVCERSHSVEELVELFSDQATVGNLMLHEPYRGIEGARTFWNEYCAAFREIDSRFSHTCGGDRTAVLEWTSEGTLRSGKSVTYRGVSILEMDESGKIERFRAYYDTSALIDHVAGHSRPEQSAAA